MPNPLSPQDVRDLLNAHIVLAGSGKALTAKWNMAQSYVGAVARGKQDPGPAILAKLNLRRVTTYELLPLIGRGE